MQLQEVLTRIDEFDPELTIYAERPFGLLSEAILAVEPEDEDDESVDPLPEEARKRGLIYFTDVSVADEVIAELRSECSEEPSAALKLKAVLHYEEYDVYM